MKKLLLIAGIVFGICSATAKADYTLYPEVDPVGTTGYNVYCSTTTPMIDINILSGEDQGRLGVVWMAIGSQSQNVAYYFSMSNAWTQFTAGGTYPPTQRFDSGMPYQYEIKQPLPISGTTDDGVVGWEVYVAKASLTDDQIAQIKKRRTWLTANQAKLEAKGVWSSEYESDENMQLAYLTQTVMANQSYVKLGVIPYVDCNPPEKEYGH